MTTFAIDTTPEKPKTVVDLVGRQTFDFERLDAYLSLGARMIDCVELMKVSQSTISKHISEKTGQTFGEYRESKLSVTRMKLVQAALDLAVGGNAAIMIFCLKNMNKWTDKNELEVKTPSNSPDTTVQAKIDLSKLSKEEKLLLLKLKQKMEIEADAHAVVET